MSENLKFSKIINTASFYEEIDGLVHKHNLTYMDAIIYFCEKNEVEIETAATMVKGNFRIRSHIQSEGEVLNYLPRSAKLPL